MAQSRRQNAGEGSPSLNAVWALKWLLRAVLAIVAAVLLWRLRQLVWATLIAAVLAYIAAPALSFLEGRVGARPALALLTGAFLLVVTALAVLALPALVRQLADFARGLPELLGAVEGYLSNLNTSMGDVAGPWLASIVGNAKTYLIEAIGRGAVRFAQGGYSVVGWLFIIPFLGFYFLRDRKRIAQALVHGIPSRHRRVMLRLAARIHKTLQGYLRGQLLISLLVGAATTLGLLVVGIPYAALLGAFMLLCNLIPYIGPFIGAVPIALVASFFGLRTLMVALIVVLAVQQLENAYISPRIMGSALDLHPAAVMLTVLCGGALLGISGLLLALPVLIVTREVVTFLVNRRIYAAAPEFTPQSPDDPAPPDP